MANQEHLDRLKADVDAWNAWRKENPAIQPDLSGPEVSDLEADLLALSDIVVNMIMPGKGPASEGELTGLDLSKADLRNANLSRANLSNTNLILSNLSGADLRHANLAGCILTSANLIEANLYDVNLNAAILRFAKLERADLTKSILHRANLDGVHAQKACFHQTDLSYTSLNEANFEEADLSEAYVYGISAWNVNVKGANQSNLRITRNNEGVITVDDIKIAQFIYTLITNENVRDAIDTLTTKLVLILGRFSRERKKVLYGIKDWLHAHDYVPVIFDFDRPVGRDFTETVVALAHIARFIVADITDPTSIAKELEAIVPRLAIPVQPLIQQEAKVYALFRDYWKYDWVLPLERYADLDHLLASFEERVIAPVEAKNTELIIKRTKALER